MKKRTRYLLGAGIGLAAAELTYVFGNSVYESLENLRSLGSESLQNSFYLIGHGLKLGASAIGSILTPTLTVRNLTKILKDGEN